MVKLSTGQGVRPIRATDAVPFAAGVRLSLHANTKVVQHLSESYMQASRPRSPNTEALPPPEDLPLPDFSRRSPQSHDPADPPPLPPPTAPMQPRAEELPTRARRPSGPTRRRGCYCSSLSTTSASSRRDLSSALRMTANPCLQRGVPWSPPRPQPDPAPIPDPPPAPPLPPLPSRRSSVSTPATPATISVFSCSDFNPTTSPASTPSSTPSTCSA
jgi:hypothetical protein